MNDLRILEHKNTSSGRRAHGAPASKYSADMLSDLVFFFENLLIAGVGLSVFLLNGVLESEYLNQHIFLVIFVCINFSILARWANIYEINKLMKKYSDCDTALICFLTSIFFLCSVIFGFDIFFMFEGKVFLVFFACALAALFMFRVLLYYGLKMVSERGLICRNLVVLGAGKQSARVLRSIVGDPPHFTRLLGVFLIDEAADAQRFEEQEVLGSIEDLLAFAREGAIDDVVVALPWNADRMVIDTIEQLKELPINVYLSSDLVGFDLKFHPVLGAFRRLPLFEVVQRPIAGWSSALKSVMDVVAASVALILLAPLLLLVALAIRLDSPGPVFFMQQRLGFNNQPFSIYKFRSMYHGDAPQPVRQATRDDPRVTRVGRIIRAASIDELPQLFNVLNGTMSLVGPRPHALSHNEEYGAQIRGYFARHKVKPGITGWAQVNGLRGETADVDLMRRRVEHDVYYTENWSLLFDIRILITTVLVVMFQKTAY